MGRLDQVILQARAVLRHAEVSLARFRAGLGAENTCHSLRYRAVAQAWARDLERMHARLSEQCIELILDPGESAEQSKVFFACYADFLHQVRRARLDLACEARAMDRRSSSAVARDVLVLGSVREDSHAT